MSRKEAKDAPGGAAAVSSKLAPRSEVGGRGDGRPRDAVAAGSGARGLPAGAGGGGRANAGGGRVIRYKTCLRNTIGDVLRARGWQEAKEGEGDWDFYWCDVAWMREHFDGTYLEEHQRICHFRNHYELTRSVARANRFFGYVVSYILLDKNNTARVNWPWLQEKFDGKEFETIAEGAGEGVNS